jgi:uncharacterized protein (DUF697 family)
MGELSPAALAEPVDDLGLAGRVRAAVKHLGAGSISDGSWFHGLVATHLAAHFERADRTHWDRVYPGVSVEDRAKREVRKTALKTAATGAVAATLATSGELLTLLTEGLAGPIGVPAALLSMVLEATYKALLQIDLVCDLGVIYDAPFGPREAGEVTALFAVTLMPRGGVPRGMADELALLENGALAARVGRRLLHGSFMRNALPILGVALSAGFSHAGTLKLGATAQGYLRTRRALAGPVARLRASLDPALLVEGVWRLATSDGHQGLLAPAAVLHLLGPELRRAVIAEPGAGDEDAWIARLAAIDPELRPALLEALYLVAGAEGTPSPGKTRLLRRLGEALEREIDFPRIERIGRHLSSGDAPL